MFNLTKTIKKLSGQKNKAYRFLWELSNQINVSMFYRMVSHSFIQIELGLAKMLMNLV